MSKTVRDRDLPAGVLETLRFAPFSAGSLHSRAVGDDPQLRLVRTNAAFIRVRTAGDGPEVLLLSDGPSSVEHFDALLALLAQRRRVHILEIPGFGFSWATDPSALTFEGAVNAVIEAADVILDGPAVLGGTCVQAHVALQIAGFRPDLCRGLLLAQATGWTQTRSWAQQQIDPTGVLGRAWQGQAVWRSIRERAAIEGWYELASADGYDVAQWQSIAREVFSRGASNSLPTLLQTWYRGVCPLPTLDVPSVILWGDADPTHNRAGSDPMGLLAHLPRAAHEVLHGVGHFLDLEVPDVLNVALDRLNRLAPSQ